MRGAPFIHVAWVWMLVAIGRAAPGPPAETRAAPPADCITLQPCTNLNGICMHKDDTCHGDDIIHNTHCGGSADCKCCYPPDTTEPPKPDCPTGMELIGGCCYSFHAENKTWGDADEACKLLHLTKTIRLAEVGTVDKCDADKLMEAIVDKGNDVWLGACDNEDIEVGPKGWVWWRNKQTLLLKNKWWYNEQPKAKQGNCLVAHRYTKHGSTKQALFKNEKCLDSPHHYVCQKF